MRYCLHLKAATTVTAQLIVRPLLASLLLAGLISVPVKLQAAARFDQNRAVQQIDDAISSMLNKRKMEATPIVDDATFVRRIYLDTIGRIPSLSEFQSFMQDTSADKRKTLVKKLVNSNLYPSHQYNYWVSVLRARSSERYHSGENYLNFIREAVSSNMPYNKFVYEMLASNGNPNEKDNGAVGYYFRDNNMLLDNLSNTTKLFLATDMSCAQCHDDPFKQWSQKDYYQLAAYSSGLKYRTENYGDFRKSKLYNDIRKNGSKSNIFRNLSELATYELSGTGTGLIRLPHDYQYRDARPLSVVKARTLFGAAPRIRISMTGLEPIKPNKRNIYPTPGRDLGTRRAFAQWVSDKSNPMFTKTIVNRIWHKIMGSNLIGELMEMDTHDFGTNPILTKKLVQTMQLLDYDLKAFETVLLSTQAYQRTTIARDLKAGEKFYFEGPIMTRLTAEQLWDSLLLLRDDQYDKYYRLQTKEDQKMKLYAKIKGKSLQQIAGMIPGSVGSPREFLKKMAAGTGSEGGMMSQQKNTKKGNQRNKKAKKGKKVALNSSPLKRNGVEIIGLPAPKKGKKTKVETGGSMSMMSMSSEESRRHSSKYRRSSEEPSPAKKGHFLLEFGQGLREAMDDTSKEPSVPQVLMLMNGHIETIINDRNASLNKHVNSGDKAKQLQTAFKLILSRDPSESEIQQFKGWSVKDVCWVLLNSNDFLFRR